MSRDAGRRSERGRTPADATHLITERSSGLLLHVTSLPGPAGSGSGDLGAAAYQFVDFLARSKQRWWQVLPIGPVGAAQSPYAAPSVFAGNPCLIDLQALQDQGLLSSSDLRSARGSHAQHPSATADLVQAYRTREPAIREAFQRFRASAKATQTGFRNFSRLHRHWLDDYALFSALKAQHEGAPWFTWPRALKNRDADALRRSRRELTDEIELVKFQQYVFDQQWRKLRAYATDHGVALMGDAPIFVAHDSADVWQRPELFQLDRRGDPTHVAGVPPDAFAEDGQWWGNPLYRWDALAKTNYAFWVERLRLILDRFDAVRLDHFIGFCRYWSIPKGAKTAREGRWKPGPGAAFFQSLAEQMGKLPLVAEDLGAITPEITGIREQFDFPGMWVLQFSFDPDRGAEPTRPHHISERCVVYTGTHDNDTTEGWYASLGSQRRRAFVDRYLNRRGGCISDDLIRQAWSSHARIAIAPVQDVLGLGTQARMNTPGTAKGNWEYRLPSMKVLTARHATHLAALSDLYGRSGSPA